MNGDVYKHARSHSPGRTQPKPADNNVLFSKIRNFNHAFSSIGSFFSNSSSDESRFDNDDEDMNGQEYWDPASEFKFALTQDSDDSAPASSHYFASRMPSRLATTPSDIETPTPTRPTTPRNPDSLDVKRIFNLSRSSSANRSQHFHDGRDHYHPDVSDGGIALSDLTDEDVRTYYRIMPSSSSSTLVASSSHSSSGSSDLDDTPPLSPDAESFGTLPSILSQEMDQHIPYDRPHLEQIREGKRPERAICYDALIDDLATDSGSPVEYQGNDRPQIDDAEEWYGLEYTLELSSKERRPSETYSYDESVGESSRSRESWAALRCGTIHPFFEDEDYYQWKNWHLYLDREDEKRKHRKGLEFKARSKDMAWFYLNEMRTREVMYWQLEVYGMIGRDVKERLAVLADHRRDPYYPPKKHNLGWYLKRSRSVACLRELQPKNTPKLISRGGRAH